MREDLRGVKTSIIFGGLIILASTLLTLAPKENESIAVIVSPWAGQNHIVNVISSSGGVIKTQDVIPWIIISHNETSDLVEKLYRNGAILVINANIVTACFKI